MNLYFLKNYYRYSEVDHTIQEVQFSNSWVLSCLYVKEILSTTQKNMIAIEAHLQTFDFQNKLEAQWASILWGGGVISGCLICTTLIDFYYFVVNLPLRNYFFQMNNEKSANKTKRLGFGAYTGARHKDDFLLVWNC